MKENVNYDILNTIMYGECVFAYDIFWVKNDQCVYMISPVFLHEFGDCNIKEAYKVWYLKNHKPLQFNDGVSKISLYFNDIEITGDILPCKDACVLVRFNGIHSNESNIKVQLVYSILGENFNLKLNLYQNNYFHTPLSCAAIMLNEHKSINDWLYWHSNIGVGIFLLYDNGSDNINELLSVMDEYNVVFISWIFPMFWDTPPGWKYGNVGVGTLYFGSQGAQQTHAIYKYKEHINWMCTNDIDEYIMPYPETKLITELNKYDYNTFLIVDNITYKTTVDVGVGRIYDKYRFREGIQEICGPSRHKVIINANKVTFGDYMAIHIMGTAIANKSLPRELLNRHNSVRMNHYRGAGRPSHASSYYDNICVIEDDIMTQISNEFLK